MNQSNKSIFIKIRNEHPNCQWALDFYFNESNLKAYEKRNINKEVRNEIENDLTQIKNNPDALVDYIANKVQLIIAKEKIINDLGSKNIGQNLLTLKELREDLNKYCGKYFASNATLISKQNNRNAVNNSSHRIQAGSTSSPDFH